MQRLSLDKGEEQESASQACRDKGKTSEESGQRVEETYKMTPFSRTVTRGGVRKTKGEEGSGYT